MIKSCTIRMLIAICLMLGFIWAGPIMMNGQVTEEKPMGTAQSNRQAGFMPLKMALRATPAQTPIDVKPFDVIRGEHVANGIGLRNRGGGTINLRGIPAHGIIIKAYLYWCVLSDSPLQNPVVSVNGKALNGTLVGSGTAPCWGVSNNYVYRTEVPNYLLYIGGNGDYEIAGVPSSEGEGISPWAPITGQILAEGATLVIFFVRNPDINIKTYVYDAPVSGTMFYSQFDANLLGFTADNTTAKLTMIGADGQIGSDISSNYDVTRELSYFQGIQIAGYSAAPSAYQDADSDWNGNDGYPLNQLWDSPSHTVPIKLNSTSAAVKYQSFGDCLVVCAFILTI